MQTGASQSNRTVGETEAIQPEHIDMSGERTIPAKLSARADEHDPTPRSDGPALWQIVIGVLALLLVYALFKR